MSDVVTRYAAAERLLPMKANDLVRRARVRPQWQNKEDVFRYSVRTESGMEWFEVDCTSGEKRPIDAVTATHPFDELPSPDESKVAFVRGFDLWVRTVASGEERQLTRDGTADRPYGRSTDAADLSWLLAMVGALPPPVAVWSPDSTRLLTHQLDQSALEQMHLVQAAPPDGGRARLHSYRYAMVGDEAVASARLVVLSADGVSRTDVVREVAVPYLSPLMTKHGWWSHDGGTVWFVDLGRAAASAELLAIDAVTGDVRVVLQETSSTHLQLAPLFFQSNVRVLDSGEIIWWSERSGWGHLYLYSSDGSCQPLTSGEWLVRDVVAVDEHRRVIWFTAAGREAGMDPYVRQLYELSLDGGEIRRITVDALDHHVLASPSQRYAIDIASWIDRPAISVLRTVSNGHHVVLEEADASLLYSAGWVAPERFEAVAADGVTRLYGLLYQPCGLDPERRYPILDDIYPGPQVNAVPVRFPGSGGLPQGQTHASAMAALGFAVVIVDGRGTPLRGKSFQDATRAGRDIVIDDHVAAIQQLASTRPWLDLDRVGIYGHSGGGQMSTRAMLVRPDFYKVAVSTAGDHDDALYHASWGERFFGSRESFDYRAAANATLAERLEGNLLLVHGDMDNNVTPHLTVRLVDAFMNVDKDVDLMIVPNSGHEMLTHQGHWIRRRWDYFVQHLMGERPPKYRLEPLPVDLGVLEELAG